MAAMKKSPKFARRHNATGPITEFLRRHFRHFNAATLVNAAEGYLHHIADGGKVLVTLAGAMSTAEIGISLAEMIRQNKVHAISCTGANLEEDIFNLVAHDKYESVPQYRNLKPSDEVRLYKQHLNRVTDTCIPDQILWQRLEEPFMNEWQLADHHDERRFPHEFVYQILRNGCIDRYYGPNRNDSWVYAAMERNLPIFVPGWEDSAIGNMYAASCIRGDLKNISTVKSGIEGMMELARWYTEVSAEHALGFFQIGGGIAGDFPICVVPMLHQDLFRTGIPKWGYSCQISDSTTSYGSYSGAVPTEKISCGQLDPKSVSYTIESDATIVVPLVFAVVLGW
jgi:deoxyhypusine synthase